MEPVAARVARRTSERIDILHPKRMVWLHSLTHGEVTQGKGCVTGELSQAKSGACMLPSRTTADRGGARQCRGHAPQTSRVSVRKIVIDAYPPAPRLVPNPPIP